MKHVCSSVCMNVNLHAFLWELVTVGMWKISLSSRKHATRPRTRRNWSHMYVSVSAWSSLKTVTGSTPFNTSDVQKDSQQFETVSDVCVRRLESEFHVCGRKREKMMSGLRKMFCFWWFVFVVWMFLSWILHVCVFRQKQTEAQTETDISETAHTFQIKSLFHVFSDLKVWYFDQKVTLYPILEGYTLLVCFFLKAPKNKCF